VPSLDGREQHGQSESLKLFPLMYDVVARYF
jgi:hypothetical protein